MTLVATFKADNAGSRGKSVGVSSGTIVAIGVIVVVDVWAGDIVVAIGTVGIVGTWSWGWSINWLGCWLEGAGFLAAGTFLNIHPSLAAFKHGFALGL